MADTVSGLPGRGQTYLTGAGRTLASSGEMDLKLGVLKNFADRDSTSTAKVMPLRSQRQVTMMFVRNVSGIALLPKRLVRWKSGYRNRQVDGYCTADYAEAAGVVDECLPAAGVPNYDGFWIAVKGPHLCLTALEGNENNVIVMDDILSALTAATSQATTAGRVWCPLYNAMTATTTSTMSIALNNLGRAMTARTTANTGGLTTGVVLVDLDILKSAN